jgi:hypothetical protein
MPVDPCASLQAGQCGVDLPDGCGGKKTCDCPKQMNAGQPLCLIAGMTAATSGQTGNCCYPATCGNQCNTTITNVCTGGTTQCTCPDTVKQYCSGTPGMCMNRLTCAQAVNGYTGAAGSPCSDGPAYNDGSGADTLTCPCNSGTNLYCIAGAAPAADVVVGATTGTCCHNANTNCMGACNTDGTTVYLPNDCVTNPADRTRCKLPGNNQFCKPCTPGMTCPPGGNGVITNFKTCADFGANGGTGSTCSNGGAFDRGDGTLLTCPCNAGTTYCQNGGSPVGNTGCGTPGSPCATGTCCGNTNTCANHQGCNTTGLTDSCTGAPIDCSCGSGSYCNGSGQCQSCTPCSGVGLGGSCNDRAPLFPPAPGESGCPNRYCYCGGGATCVGETSSTDGTCQCTNTTCNGCAAGQTDSCGNPLSCGCTTPQVCNTSTNSCCSVTSSCSSPPGGVPAGACSFTNECGQPTYCTCPGSNTRCVPGGSYGTCCSYGDCSNPPSGIPTSPPPGTTGGVCSYSACGITTGCPCTAPSSTCQPVAGTSYSTCCQYNNSCSSPPAGVPTSPAPGTIGGVCSFDAGCGMRGSCGCPAAPAGATMACTPVSGTSYSICQCTTAPCCSAGQVTPYTDACGNFCGCHG